jgi:hypothetical protein
MCRNAFIVFQHAVKIVWFAVFYTTAAPLPEYDSATAKKVVKSLDFSQFKSDDKALSDMGDRLYGSTSNATAQKWLAKQLEDYGYKVTIQSTYKNVMCTKVGAISPDSGYIIGAHYDGRSGGGAADDNASGTSLILQAARVFFNPAVKTHYSIRFVLFNCEETGINGSNAYATERKSLQGKEDPAGSKLYPEPRWMGVIAHDMILFDHGVPPQANQIPGADIDIEYKAGTTFATQSLALAQALATGAGLFGSYPAGIGSNMAMTDSDPFKNLVASVSIRENPRMSEIGSGSNPHYHTNTDNYSVYSEKDFQFGFSTVQTTVGTICRLAKVFDSTTTAITDYPVKNNFSTMIPADKACIFDISGRLIMELNGTFTPQTFTGKNPSLTKLARGLYIVRLIKDNQSVGPGYLRLLKE